jgi:hypothetical protein
VPIDVALEDIDPALVAQGVVQAHRVRQGDIARIPQLVFGYALRRGDRRDPHEREEARAVRDRERVQLNRVAFRQRIEEQHLQAGRVRLESDDAAPLPSWRAASSV